MDFSNIYQQLKFADYKISADERIKITTYLKRKDAALQPETHAAILVFCHSTCDPTSENIALVEKFLAKNTNDYTRSAAVNGLYRIWSLSSTSHLETLLSLVDRLLEEAWHDTSIVAFGCATDLMHQVSDQRLVRAVKRSLELLHEEVKRENDFAVPMFVHSCWSLYAAWARISGGRRIHFDSLDEALLIYWNRAEYLPEQAN